MKNLELLGKLADIQHEIWAHWMRYLFKVCVQNEDGTVTIPAEQVKRWQRQMNTKYADLPSSEQKSDLEQAEKVIAAIDLNSAFRQSDSSKVEE